MRRLLRRSSVDTRRITFPAKSRSGVASLAAIFVALCGYGCGGKETGPSFDLLDPGTGEVNSEPLWPLRPGMSLTNVPQASLRGDNASHSRIAAGESGQRGRYLPGIYAEDNLIGETLFASAPHLVHGHQALLFGSRNQTDVIQPIADIRTPHQPQDVGWWSRGPKGVSLLGQPRAFFDRPALIFPNEVRVGMRWRTGKIGGKNVYTVSVTDRTVRDTIFGRRPVWRIAFTDERAIQIDTFDCRHEPPEFVVEVVEGRGPLMMEASLRNYANFLEPLGAVVPLEDPPESESPFAAAQTPRPLTQLLENFAPTGMRAIQEPGDLYPRHLIVTGETEGFQTDVFGDILSMEQVVFGTSRCFDYSEEEGFVATEDCYEAVSVWIDPDGSSESIPSLLGGDTYPWQRRNDMNCVFGCYAYEPSGVFADSDGQSWVLAGTGREFVIGGMPEIGDVKNDLVDPLALGRVLLQNGSELRLTTPFEGGVAIGSVFSSQLSYGAYEHATGQVRDAHVATHLMGGLGILTRAGEREVLRAYPDGRVERLIFDSEGVRVQPVANVAVDEGNILAAAIPWGDEILVLQGSGFRGRSGTDLGEELDIDEVGEQCDRQNVQIDVGVSELGIVDLKAGDAAPESPLYSLRYEQHGSDAVLCWPPEFGSAEPSGWTLGGQPAVTKDLGGGCTFLMREVAPGTEYGQLNYEAIGPIPTIGRTALTLAPTEQSLVFPPCAPLTGGGCVSGQGRYWPGLLGWSSTGYYKVDEVSVFGRRATFADLGGAGLWGYHRVNFETPLVIQLLRGSGRDEYGVGGIIATVEGGGLAVRFADRNVIVSEDGSEQPLSDRALPSTTWFPRLVFPDGTVCGLNLATTIIDENFHEDGGLCWPPAAVEPVRLIQSQDFWFSEPSWLPTGGDLIYVHSADQLISANLTTGEFVVFTAEDFGAPANSALTYSSARGPLGKSYFIVGIDGVSSLFELTATGHQAIESPRLGLLTGGAPEFMVDEDYIIIEPGVRIARGD